MRVSRVLPRRLTGGRIIKNRLLSSLLFSGNFCGGQSCDWGDSLSLQTGENSAICKKNLFSSILHIFGIFSHFIIFFQC